MNKSPKSHALFFNRNINGVPLARKTPPPRVTMADPPEMHIAQSNMLGGRSGNIRATYDELIGWLGKPNANPKGDEQDGKIKARWLISTTDNQVFAIWCYKYTMARYCVDWSTNGDSNLMKNIFKNRYE